MSDGSSTSGTEERPAGAGKPRAGDRSPGGRPRDEADAEAAAAERDADGGEDAAEAGDADGSGEADGSSPDRLTEELTQLNDRHLRLAAEFQNYRRRSETQLTEAWARAQAELVGRLLEVLDDLQRVSELDPADEAVTAQSLVEGVDLVERKFLRSLEEAGVEVIDPAGEAFDPETMEAMMRVPAESPEDDDVVDQVFQKGYQLKGQLVRPARVSVLKHG